jgi:MoxR-like ATPase
MPLPKPLLRSSNRPSLRPSKPLPTKAERAEKAVKEAAAFEEAVQEVPVKYDNPLFEKLQKVRSVLNEFVYERHDETDGILLCILSGSNALFFGDVGTAKTFHIQTASSLLGLSNFDILMSETVKPDQIFGPTDIPALAQGRQQTKYIGYAPDCEILFFDEIFKSNATVLNPLLWIINEHLFRDGDNGIIKCKVKATFAASNELPNDPILKALYDRFLLRFNVAYLKDEENVRKLIAKSLDIPDLIETHYLTSPEVEQLRKTTRAVTLPDKLRDMAMRIRRQVEYALNIKISDRRFIKSFRVMQAAAILDGRSEIINKDLEVLANIFWNEPAQVSKVQSIVFSNTSGDTAEISTYLERAHALRETIGQGGDLRSKLSELKKLYAEVNKLSSRYARQAAAEIKSIGMSFAHIIKERKVFRIIRVHVGAGIQIKASQSSTMSWSSKELRAFGFRHKRKANYWYSDHKLTTLKQTFIKAGITLEVSSLAKTE